MQTPQDRRWKIAIGCLSVPAYIIGASALVYLIWRFFALPLSNMLGDPGYPIALGGVWVLIVAIGAWRAVVILSEEGLFRVRDSGDTTGRDSLAFRVGLLVVVLLIAICLVYGLIPAYISGQFAWLGGPAGLSNCICDWCYQNNPCPATLTAVASWKTPPAWWPRSLPGPAGTPPP